MRSTSGSGAEARLLLVDRDPGSRRALIDDLGTFPGCPDVIASAGSGREAADMLRAGQFDVVVVDLGSIIDLSSSCEEAVSRLVKLAEGALVIAISEGMSVSAAVGSMRAGAHDYICKPISGRALGERIEELALRHAKPHALVADDGRVNAPTDFEGFIGRSAQIQCVFEQIDRIAPSSAPVFITGESGTGKEVCAEALHRRGAKAKGPFIAINCGAIPRELIETELFGAMRGAFTGAMEDRKGALNSPMAARCFWTRSGKWISRSKPSFCVSCKRAP